MRKPKAPQPSNEEVVLRQRQIEELARLDEEENTRVKRLVRGRLGSSTLLGRRGAPKAAASTGPTGAAREAGRGRAGAYI